MRRQTARPPVENRDLLFRLADAAQYEAKRENAELPVVAGPEQRRLVETPAETPEDRRRVRRVQPARGPNR